MIYPDLRQNHVRSEHALDHHSDAPAGFLAAEKARLDHPRIVEHHDVAGSNEADDVPELPVTPGTGRAVEMQKPARAALRGGKLRDQLLRQLVVEVIAAHRPIIEA